MKSSEKIFGAQRYLDLMGEISPAKKVAHSGPCPKRSFDRFMEAKEVAEAGKMASIITGGDPSVFGSGWRIMDLAKGSVPVHVSPGVSAFSSVAANAGAPLVNDFVLLSNPEDRSMLSLLAGAGFGVVVYNVKGHLIASLLQDVDPLRPVVLARDVARDGEEMMIHERRGPAGRKSIRFPLHLNCRLLKFLHKRGPNNNQKGIRGQIQLLRLIA